MSIALGKLAQEDPSFRVHVDQESVKRLSLVWVNYILRLLLTYEEGI